MELDEFMPQFYDFYGSVDLFWSFVLIGRHVRSVGVLEKALRGIDWMFCGPSCPRVPPQCCPHVDFYQKGSHP